MVKRTLALVGCLLLSATLARLTAATKLFLTPRSTGEVVISVDPFLHQEFGLAYPVTYKFTIPPGSSNLTVSAKYADEAAWTPLTEKTASDYFNGEQVVRFDYAGGAAYVSVGFDSTSDDIFLRATDGTGQPVNFTFQNICKYYDNRQSAVTVTADDWKDSTNAAFVQSVHMFRTYRLPITVAIITGGTTAPIWQIIQSELDSGLVEAASHTRSHVNPPYPDPISEIVGSKQDLLANLRMPPDFRNGSQGYVYTWIAPFGSTTTSTELVVSEAGYLVDRMTFPSTGTFTAWDTTQHRYLMDGRTTEMGPFWGGSTNLATLNNLFDQSMSSGKIYHLLLHPQILADSGYWYRPWTTGHLDHISNRTNVWYVNFGTLYAYHLLQDDAPGTIVVAPGAPVITGQPANVTAHWRETATFSVDAIGSAPLMYQWKLNGADIAGATSGVYSTSALGPLDSNTVYSCVVSNSLGSVTSKGATLTVIPPNILTNPGFESGTTPWVFWTNGAGSMTQIPFGTDGTKSAQLTITAQGTNVQLYQANLTVQPNADYKLTFDAYSNTGHDLDVSLSKNATPYTNYGLAGRTFGLGTGWQSYSVTFKTSGFSGTVSDARLWFSLAAYDSAGDVYHIDNVRLARVVDLFPPGVTPPAITVQPAGQTVMVGQTATFTVTATGTAPLLYQWQKRDVDINGATMSSYTTPATISSDSGAIYRCRVTNASGSVTSSDAALTVITPRPPVITVQPLDTTAREGNPVHFAVVATGDTVLTYQWQKNGTAIPEATTATYSIPSASRADSGATYRCIVANNAGKDTSRSALLRVLALPPTQYLVSPGLETVGLTISPTLFWHQTTGALSYQIQVSTDSTFSTGLLVNDSTITDTSYQLHGLPYVTRYYWRVKAVGTGGQFSAVWSFTTTIGPAAVPALVSPVNGTAGLATAAVDFVWTSSRWAAGYHLQVSTDSTFAAGIAFDDSTLSDTARSVTTLLTDRHYYWRVSARGSGGNSSHSSTWSFETIKTTPLAASLVYPVNGSTGLPSTGLTFRWNKIVPVTSYTFQLGTDSTFATGLEKNDTTEVDTHRTVNGLKPGTRFFWRVRGRNSAGWGEFSPPWSLTTVVPSPGKVALYGPPTGALASTDSSLFTWFKPTPAATRYWFEISIDSTFSSLDVVDSTVADTEFVFRPLGDNQYYWRVRGWNPGGWGPFSETRTLRVVINSVAEHPGVPLTYVLEQNHPNPFNPSTKIGFGLPSVSQARLEVYNVLGQRVATLLDDRLPAGYHTVTFEASGFPSGVYIYRLLTDKEALVRKMILMK